MSDALLLSLLWLIPLAGSMVVLMIPKAFASSAKYVALGATSLMFLLTIYAFTVYTAEGSNASKPLAERAGNNSLKVLRSGKYQDSTESQVTAAGQGDLMVREHWISYFEMQYYLGLDGISLSLVMLTGLVSVLACVASWNIEKQVKGYYSLFLLLTASMMGVFMALDLFLFYVFFEVMLLPMYFLIAVWGGDNREYAAIKFLLYTLFGSVFILVAVLILFFYTGDAPVTGFKAHTFDIVRLTKYATESTYYGPGIQKAIFALFLVGFCVKLPSFPFHTWLPDAHVQAPTPISMILAGVLLKIGGYGLIRLAWPLAPAGAYAMSYWVAALGVFSILYGALVAMAQTDFKKLVAYSSVSHMGYVTLGMAVMTLASNSDPRYYGYGVNGAMFMMIAHGITSTGMFFLVGVIYERAHTRDLRHLGGLMNMMPIYGAVSIIIFFGSMGLPGLCGFVAEATVVLAAFNFDPLLAVLAAAAVILTAGYILWTLQRVFLGQHEAAHGDSHGHGHGDEHAYSFPDLSVRELIIAVPLVVLTVLLGVFPQQLLLSWMGPSVTDVVNAVASAKTLPNEPAAKAVILEGVAAEKTAAVTESPAPASGLRDR